MTLQELQQIKDSLSQGVMIHKGKWIEVLDAAIARLEDGPVGMVCMVNGKKEIVPMLPRFKDERFADRLRPGTMVMAPGVREET